MSDETRVQALLESRPSDKVKKRPQISDAMRSRLGPQTLYKNRPHTTISLGAHSEPSSSPTLQGHAARPPVTRVGKDPSHIALSGSISRRLDDMLSTPFNSRIIKYEPPRGFIVLKFSTSPDGTRRATIRGKSLVATQVRILGTSLWVALAPEPKIGSLWHRYKLGCFGTK